MLKFDNDKSAGEISKELKTPVGEIGCPECGSTAHGALQAACPFCGTLRFKEQLKQILSDDIIKQLEKELWESY